MPRHGDLCLTDDRSRDYSLQPVYDDAITCQQSLFDSAQPEMSLAQLHWSWDDFVLVIDDVDYFLAQI